MTDLQAPLTEGSLAPTIGSAGSVSGGGSGGGGGGVGGGGGGGAAGGVVLRGAQSIGVGTQGVAVAETGKREEREADLRAPLTEGS